MASETDWGIPYPESTDDVILWTKLQAMAEAIDTILTIPDPVSNGANGSNTITSTSYAALPTTPISVSITNPSSVYRLLVDVRISAWMASTVTTVELTASVNGSGGMTFAAGSTGNGHAVAQSENLLTTLGSTAQQYASSVPIIIPAGAAAVTLAMYAKRNSASGTQSLLQPVIRAIPMRFMLP